ncbi:antitoxin [Ilumatobacter sp.]|uniref:antitoxin n=2 Tax=Ilumatobacter sp. TaxID=1967498 RepID=UPI0037517999
MGLLNARNLLKAKELIEKNRHKVGDVVGKATQKIDKASGGKTTNFSKKAEDAARKYSSGSSATHHGDRSDTASGNDSNSAPMTQEEVETRRTEAQVKAAEAMAALAHAAEELLIKAQKIADEAGLQTDGTIKPPDASQAATDVPPPLTSN